MPSPLIAIVAAMLLLGPAPEADKTWKDKAAAAVKRATATPTVANLRDALDATYRADDWQSGLRVAEQAAAKFPNEAKLRGLVARTLWRGGRIAEAERLVAKVSEQTTDHVAVRMAIAVHLARGEHEAADQWAARLEKLKPDCAEDWHYVFSVRLIRGKMVGLAEIVRQTERALDLSGGYPDTHMDESISGVADFLDAVGPQPLNQLAQPGSAPMTALVMFNLPACDVMINGKGPYRMVVDTGGSIMVAVDEKVANEIGLKSLGTASVRGVGGRQETGQALIDDLRIGTIACKRVMARTFDVHSAIMNAADGIIGTGIFADGRMTLDFVGGRLSVARSGSTPAPGHAADLRLVGDAKMMALVMLEKQPGLALLDTGADAVALAPSRLKTLFPDEEIQTFNPGLALGVGAGTTPEISLNPGVKLVFAGRTFDNYSGLGLDALDTTLGPYMGIQSDILIGMPMFREMKTCTVDFPRCKMWVEWLDADR